MEGGSVRLYVALVAVLGQVLAALGRRLRRRRPPLVDDTGLALGEEEGA